jgi:hypothetical protein
MSLTARSKFAVRPASTAALMAPADVPAMIENGFGAPVGSNDATAFSTPTW